MLIARGTFTPGQGHEMRGGFTIKNQEGRFLMETTEDFYFDGSPDPGFALNIGIPQSASDPELRQRMAATRFLNLPGQVVEVRGRHAGEIPPTLDLVAFDMLVLWCFGFPFILGFGVIERV
ncbi:hypothetical protein [Roseicyclus sp.]|uniref:hypothetical protein n=1 Tax=Roseicyclus sp. TaxID=1914329 RepID=UPI001BCF04B5|nr:hypothetical protein [Roseicyclus sp.]